MHGAVFFVGTYSVIKITRYFLLPVFTAILAFIERNMNHSFHSALWRQKAEEQATEVAAISFRLKMQG